MKIHYKNYHPKFDIWLDRSSDRIRPYGTDKFPVRRSRPAMLWSTSSAPVTTAIDQYPANYVIGKDNKTTSSSSIPGQNTNRVRYMDENRQRKIAELSEQYLSYQKALEDQNYTIYRVSGDGNCLFRAVSHQIYGDDSYHGIVRQKCMDYMESESAFFSQFVVGGMESFPIYLTAKRRDGCWGDDPEIEAICELYNRPAEIWAYDASRGARKLRTFHETTQPTSRLTSSSSLQVPSGYSYGDANSIPINRNQGGSQGNNSTPRNNNSSNNRNNQQENVDPADDDFELSGPPVMRLSYYGGGHYDSIVDRSHLTCTLRSRPGEYEERMIALSRRRCQQTTNRTINSNNVDSNVVDQVQRMTDIEATNQAALNLAIQESRRQQMNSEYDDLESCLALSLNSFYQAEGKPSSSSSSKVADFKGEDLKNLEMNSQDEALGLQGEVLKSIQAESERDYLDHVILKSLADTNQSKSLNDEEEQLLQATLLSSAKEIEEKFIQESKNASDQEMELALKLSSLSEEEALELALKESINHSQSNSSMQDTRHPNLSVLPNASTTPGSNNYAHLSEDELLQIAMQESLQSYQPPASTTSTQSSHQPEHAMMIYGDELDYDEELMRAIQESLRK